MKICAVLAVLVLAVGCLCGCGDKDEKAAGTTEITGITGITGTTETTGTTGIAVTTGTTETTGTTGITGTTEITGITGTTGTTVTAETTVSPLAGKWDDVSVKTTNVRNGEKSERDDTEEGYFLLLFADGKYGYFSPYSDRCYRAEVFGNSYYMVKDDRIIFAINGEQYEMNFELDGNLLTLIEKQDYDNGDYSMSVHIMKRDKTADTCDKELHGIWNGALKGEDARTLIFTELGLCIETDCSKDDTTRKKGYAFAYELRDGKVSMDGGLEVPGMKGTYTLDGDLLIIRAREYNAEYNMYGSELPEFVLTRQN